MKIPCSGVILAGGLKSRVSGTNKALIRVEGQYILDRIYGVFREVFDEIILVTNDPLQYLDWDLVIMSDIFSVRSSLTGIHSGLFCATHPYAFFTACDTPFLKKELVKSLVNRIEDRFDVIIPETSAGLEPLCAIYSRKCIQPIEARLERQQFKIRQFFKKLRVKKVREDVLRENDPNLISFFNINTPDELEKARNIR
jgi:molybdopterin-guanine dinucleotide biosynthesis protein A